MQVISGYADNNRSKLLEFRLYHLNRPNLSTWRRTRHGGEYSLDLADKLAMELASNCIVAVDCAGWYFNLFNVNSQCFESNNISKLYYPNCFVEPDLLVHRPTYANDDVVLVKFPYFLRYATVDQLINFVNLWCSRSMILNFSTIHVQHNHLKYNLIDIVKHKTDLTITEVNKKIWRIIK